MTNRHRLTDVETVEGEGSWLFTVRGEHGANQEIVLVPCEEDSKDVEAWINNCTHENQRLYREGVGVVMRDGGIVCPKHGSVFDACSGGCDNGPASQTTLPSVEIAIEDGQVYLTDESVDFLWEGPDTTEDEDDGPSSTSHLRF